VKQRSAIGLAGVATAVFLSSCAQNAPQDTFRPDGENARKINNLQIPVFIAAGVVGVIVFSVIIYVVVKYRDRGQEMPRQTHGNPTLEIGLTILPAVILIAVGIPTISTVFSLAKSSDTQCVINVTGQQWWWEYEYPVQSAAASTSPSRSSPAVNS
jgi:cytochrome c oxidase subunit 2